MSDSLVCPVCGKGKIVKGTIGYVCNHFKSINDKCTFNIYSSYFNKTVTDDMVSDLVIHGQTHVFDDFQRKDDTFFSASLVIESGLVKPKFVNDILDVPCPTCGGSIESLLHNYACPQCSTTESSFVCVPKSICGVPITKPIAECLLKGEVTPILDGFTNNSGATFSSRLVLSDTKVLFNNFLCTCPKCGGNMYVGNKAYNCSNYKNEKVKCDFVIWREMLGRSISLQEALSLCENKETDILSGFYTKGELVHKKLIINDVFKVKLV